MTEILKQIIDRKGNKVDFDITRIENALIKAGSSTGEFDEEKARHLSTLVKQCLISRYEVDKVSVEDIQDTVEFILFQNNYQKTMKSYVQYRHDHEKMRTSRKAEVDAISTFDEYINGKDWRIKANANQGYSLGGLILNSAGKLTANYWLKHVYPPEVGQAHLDGRYHIHDLDFLSVYCLGHDLKELLEEGFGGVPGKLNSGPAKHLSSAVMQMVNFIGCLQNESAGAQSFSSVDTLLAPYIRKNLEEQIKDYVKIKFGKDLTKEELNKVYKKYLSRKKYRNVS